MIRDDSEIAYYVNDKKRRRITKADLQRADNYHHEYAKWLMDLRTADIQAFIAKHGEEFPRLNDDKIAFRVSARPGFDKYIYSLRGQKFIPEPLPSYAPTAWLNK